MATKQVGAAVSNLTDPATKAYVDALFGYASGDPLTRWKIALAARAATPARILAIGDSIMGGHGGTTRAGSWLNKAITRLRANNPTSGVTGGAGYMPAYYGGTDSWAAWYTASTGTITDGAGTSLGYQSSTFAAAATRTYPFTGDGIDIISNGSGTYTYAIDGAGATTVTGTGARQTKTITGLTAAAHSIVITATSSFVLEGFTIYNGDRSAGILLYDSTKYGAATSAFNADTTGYQAAINAIASPDLVLVELGANDAVSVSAATYKTNLQTLITALQGLTKVPSILIVSDHLQKYTYPQGPWSGYVAAAKAVAAASGVAYLDLSVLVPAVQDTAGTGLYATDGWHPNNAGHARFGNLVSLSIDPTHTPLFVDPFSGVDASMPTSDWTVAFGTAAQSLGKLVATTGTSQTQYNPVRLDRGTMAVQGDTEVTATIATSSTAVEQYVELCINSNLSTSDVHGIANAYALELSFNATAASSTVSIDLFNGTDSVLATVTKTLTGGVTYKTRFARVGQQLFGKVWDASIAEPAAWDVTYTISGTPLTGKVSLMGQGGANTTARTFTFDDITVW